MGWAYTFRNADTGRFIPGEEYGTKYAWVDECYKDLEKCPLCALHFSKNDNGEFYVDKWTLDRNDPLWNEYYFMTFNLACYISADNAAMIEKNNLCSDVVGFLTRMIEEEGCSGLIMEWC